MFLLWDVWLEWGDVQTLIMFLLYIFKMIWLFFFFFFLFLRTKDFFFFNSFLYVDSPTIIIISIRFLVYFFIYNFSFYYSIFSEKIFSEFFFFFVIFFVTICFLSSFPFYYILFLEFCVFPMFFLIFIFGKDYDKGSSGVFIVLLNLLGSIPFIIYSVNSFLSFVSLHLYYFFYRYFLDFFLFFCFLLVFISKLPIFLFHFWLTKAHVSASGSCSILLASLMLKLGSFGLFKFSFSFYHYSLILSWIIFTFSLMGGLIFIIYIIRFLDFKNLVASSSVVHIALLFPFCLFNRSFMNFSSLWMMLSHGVISYALFFLVTLIYEVTQNRSFDLIKSLERVNKNIIMFVFIFFLLNLGFPPFINFLTELYFCASLLLNNYFLTLIFCFLMLVSIIVFIFTVTKFIFGKKIIQSSLDYSSLLNFKFFSLGYTSVFIVFFY